MGRKDLILPVYYIGCPVLDDAALRQNDALAQAIAARQWEDWREMRHELLTTPLVGKALTRLATQICNALERIGTPVPVSPAPQTPTLIVDSMHRGDFVTISEAIAAATPGTRILVRPGVYQEALVMDKALEIIGDGKPGDVVVQAKGKDVLRFETTTGRVANLTLQQTGDGICVGALITQGRLEMDDCDITSRSLSCVEIRNDADPRLRRCRIHNGKNNGVMFCANGQGTLEDCDIFGHALCGVVVKEGGNPTIRCCRIQDNKRAGVLVCENGRGVLEENDIFGNAQHGVEIREGGNPILRHNRIHDNKLSGVDVHTNERGRLEDNDIISNAGCGAAISGDSRTTLRNNRINRNTYNAVWIHDGGGGIFEDNDLRDNVKDAWDIAADCKNKVTRARNLQ